MIRKAGVADAGLVAGLLRDFNTEFDTSVPQDVDARRFYERHGFTNIEAGSRMLLYVQEL